MNKVIVDNIEDFNCIHDQMIAIYLGYDDQEMFVPTFITDVYKMTAGVWSGLTIVT